MGLTVNVQKVTAQMLPNTHITPTPKDLHINKTKKTMQTKKQSLKEAISNTAVGFIVSYISTFLIFPLVGVETSPGANFVIVVYFTAVSISRGYIIRRWFNKKVTNPKQN